MVQDSKYVPCSDFSHAICILLGWLIDEVATWLHTDDSEGVGAQWQ